MHQNTPFISTDIREIELYAIYGLNCKLQHLLHCTVITFRWAGPDEREILLPVDQSKFMSTIKSRLLFYERFQNMGSLETSILETRTNFCNRLRRNHIVKLQSKVQTTVLGLGVDYVFPLSQQQQQE